jgi:hypothetical protein
MDFVRFLISLNMGDLAVRAIELQHSIKGSVGLMLSEMLALTGVMLGLFDVSA